VEAVTILRMVTPGTSLTGMDLPQEQSTGWWLRTCPPGSAGRT